MTKGAKVMKEEMEYIEEEIAVLDIKIKKDSFY